MPNRKTILNQLKEDLGKIQSSRGYLTDPVEIAHGITSFDFFNQRPAISFVMIADEVTDEYYDDNRFREMSVYIYCFADVELNNYNPIYDLAEDIETFLYSNDWSYTDNTLLGDVIITPGGTDNMRAMCDTIVQVKYCQEL
jgi:hypothetical protein